MKTRIILLLLFFMDVLCNAQIIHPDTATIVAQNYINSITNSLNKVEKTIPNISDDTICFYTVLFENNISCMVSSTTYAPPILSYSFNEMSTDEADSVCPPAYRDLQNWYIKQIKTIIRDTTLYDYDDRWTSLINNQIVQNDTVSGFAILDSIDGFAIQWGQRGNNSNYYACDKAYNHECPWVPFITCNKGYAGCGPVAMGQLMRYWKWPLKSDYRLYHWEKMPGAITDQTSTEKALEIAYLLQDCGDASHSIYSHWATATIMDNIEYALRSIFGYENISKYRIGEWSYGSSWSELIKSELNNSRPILFYGDNGIPFNGHYFIIDGYKYYNGQILFHVNWGHKGNHNDFFYIDDFSEDGDDYRRSNHAIVGISPTYNESAITHLNYDKVTPNSKRTEYAYNSIAIPSIGETLTVENNAHYTIEAGYEIELLPGFEAQFGSEVDIRINPAWQSHMAISVPYWPTANEQDGYCLMPTNADSWEFSAFDLSGNVVYQSAGSIRSESVCMWDCENALPGTYFCIVTLKNSFGRKLTNQHSFTVIQHGRNTPDESDESYSILQEEAMYSINPSIDNIDTTLTIYPNPSKDVFNIHISSGTIENITVYDNQSHTIYVDNNINSQEYLLNLQNHPRGLYTVNILSGNKYYSSSVLKQ